MEIKMLAPHGNTKYYRQIQDSVKETYYLKREDIYQDYINWNIHGMFDGDTLLCSCVIEEHNELVFMKRFVMVGEYGKGYFKQMVELILETQPHICLTIEPTNHKVAKMLNELGFVNTGEVIDKTGKYTYELYQGGRA